MYSLIFQTHKVVVVLFLLIYLIKTILLLSNSTEKLTKFTKTFKIPEMIVSFLFLITGGYMLTEIPEINTFMLIKLIAVFVSIPLAVVGFKKSNKLLAGLSMILIISAYGLAEVSKKRAAKATLPEATAVLDGKDIYNTNCARCHGEDGKMGVMGATDLSVSSIDRGMVSEVIIKGKGAMAGFKGQLSNEQIDAVSGYIETLRK